MAACTECPKPARGLGLCAMHYSRWVRHGDVNRGYQCAPLANRFWPKVDRSGDHWIWTGAQDGKGYGHIQRGGQGGGTVKAHQVAYELCVGPVPEGMEIDHLCRVTACVRPDHLEAVTHRENMRRGKIATSTTCRRGHPWTAETTQIIPAGTRLCRVCVRRREVIRAAARRRLAVAS